MTIARPLFHLTRVIAWEDGTQETQLVPVTALPEDATVDRRSFPGVALSIASVLPLLPATGCTPRGEHDDDEPPPPDQPEGGLGGILWGGSGGGTGGGGTTSRSWSQRCGAPIPPGATCTCNCVPVCQAHRLHDSDPVVRHMAEQLLLTMGAPHLNYMTWAAAHTDRRTRTRILEVVSAIQAGACTDRSRWPSASDCIARLDAGDEVVAIMAAQLLNLQALDGSVALGDRLRTRVAARLADAAERPWFMRRGVASA